MSHWKAIKGAVISNFSENAVVSSVLPYYRKTQTTLNKPTDAAELNQQ
jgi:hypothetical protein